MDDVIMMMVSGAKHVGVAERSKAPDSRVFFWVFWSTMWAWVRIPPPTHDFHNEQH